MMLDDADELKIAKIIALRPPPPSPSGAVSGYARRMARAVVATEVAPGGFLAALRGVLDARLAVAIEQDDGALVRALMDFEPNRAQGRGPRLESFTRIGPGGPLEELLVRIDRHLFSARGERSWVRRDSDGREVYERRFSLRYGGEWTYRVIRTGDGSVVVHHAQNADVARLLAHLGCLWDEALAARDPRRRLEAIAEFEWWFMATNVTARSGAGIGDALSLSLQRTAGLALRSSFRRLDCEALCRSPQEYIAWRSRTK